MKVLKAPGTTSYLPQQTLDRLQPHSENRVLTDSEQGWGEHQGRSQEGSEPSSATDHHHPVSNSNPTQMLFPK